MRQLHRMPHEAVRRDRSNFVLITGLTIVFLLFAIPVLAFAQWSLLPFLAVPIVGLAMGMILERVKKRARAYNELVPEYVDYIKRYRQLHPLPGNKTLKEEIFEMISDVFSSIRRQAFVVRPLYITLLGLLIFIVGASQSLENRVIEVLPLSELWLWQDYWWAIAYLIPGGIGTIWNIRQSSDKVFYVIFLVINFASLGLLLQLFYIGSLGFYANLEPEMQIAIANNTITVDMLTYLLGMVFGAFMAIYMFSWLASIVLIMFNFDIFYKHHDKEKRKRDELDHSRLADDAPHTDALEASPQTLGHSQLEMSK